MSPPAAGEHPRERSRRRWRGLSRLAALVAVSAAAIIVAETLGRYVEPGKALAERFERLESPRLAGALPGRRRADTRHGALSGVCR